MHSQSISDRVPSPQNSGGQEQKVDLKSTSLAAKEDVSGALDTNLACIKATPKSARYKTQQAVTSTTAQDRKSSISSTSHKVVSEADKSVQSMHNQYKSQSIFEIKEGAT